MSAQDLASAAYGAGFRGQGLVLAIAVGLAESGGNLNATHTNADAQATVDRGPWQLNSFWHAEVSDACAYDWNCAAAAAFRISSGGSNWSQWSTYGGGQYLAQIPWATALAAKAASGVSPVTLPTIALPSLPTIDLSGFGLGSGGSPSLGPVAVLAGAGLLIWILT